MQAHGYLAIGQFTERTAVLVLYADRVSAFVGKPGVVQDPERLAFLLAGGGGQPFPIGSQGQGLWLTNCWSACSSPSGNRGSMAPTLLRSPSSNRPRT
jgi:hypothetical protein